MVPVDSRLVRELADGARAYVPDHGSGTVSMIDTVTNTVTDTVPVGEFPYGVAITPDGARLCHALSPTAVSVIDSATNTAIAAQNRTRSSHPYPPGWSRLRGYGASSTGSLALDLLTLLNEPAPSGSTSTARVLGAVASPRY